MYNISYKGEKDEWQIVPWSEVNFCFLCLPPTPGPDSTILWGNGFDVASL